MKTNRPFNWFGYLTLKYRRNKQKEHNCKTRQDTVWLDKTETVIFDKRGL